MQCEYCPECVVSFPTSMFGLCSKLTYLLTPCSRVLLEKLTGSQLVKKFPAFYGMRRFITEFTSARHLSLSWARSIQSIPLHPTFWRSILILSSHLRLSIPSGLFPSGFPTTILYTHLLSPMRVTRLVHPTEKNIIPCSYRVHFVPPNLLYTHQIHVHNTGKN